MIGTVLGGRYELLELIGTGGMADVYKARCVLLNRIVAVKILKKDLEGGEEFLQRFNVEAQSAARITHPNIVSIFDIGEENEMHYIVMEYVDGITLKKYINEKGKLDYKEALNIAYQICDALEAAHEKNIVHRDIKPHNILITDDNEVKVADFGIARSGTGKTLSSGNDILGSVHYISPEQAKGDVVDRRSDIYSLGIVMYEMITGNVPFDADTPVAVAMKQINEYPDNIISDDLKIPYGIQQIIFKAIAKQPEMRYQNAAEMKHDLLRVMDNPSYVIHDPYAYENTDNVGAEPVFSQKESAGTVKISKSMKTLIIVLSIITSLLVVSLGTVIVTKVMSNGGKTISSAEVEVPNLIGCTLQDAQKKCENLGLKIIVQDRIEDEDAEPGTILSQKPQKSEKVKRDSTVKVIINKENDNEIIFSDYTGKNYEKAQQELEDLKITVNVIYEESKKDADTVIRQSPQKGAKLKAGSSVSLYVSKGADNSETYVTVPKIVGKTYSQANSLLKSQNLSLGTISGNTNPNSNDIIISQSIPAGSLVKKGCEIGIAFKEKESENNTASDKSETTQQPSPSKPKEENTSNNTSSNDNASNEINRQGEKGTNTENNNND